MKKKTANSAAYRRVKTAIQQTIEEIRVQCPEAAEYLDQHMVFDPVKETVCYTGDDRLKMEYVPGPIPMEPTYYQTPSGTNRARLGIGKKD